MITLHYKSKLITILLLLVFKFTSTHSQNILFIDSQKSCDNIVDSVLSQYIGNIVKSNSYKKKVFIIEDSIVFTSNSNFKIKNVVKINNSHKIPYKKGTYKLKAINCEYFYSDSAIQTTVTYELVKRVKRRLSKSEGYFTFRIENNFIKPLITIQLEGGIKPLIIFECSMFCS